MGAGLWAGLCWAVWSWGNGHESVFYFGLRERPSPPLQRRDELDWTWDEGANTCLYTGMLEMVTRTTRQNGGPEREKKETRTTALWWL
ncbi:hypothetical protein M431DRAFT_511231 [Trichoderma harzianum CBS 226.95]|uniref:Secreted protein n=1 Tax=Trichoderma harzianum CBS 226.95 TaxID=983964 RepID=A0A2T4A206_TRIHA|nr:hypothetical protein M431DRAFT_511231 [Trichoderma harzianum CBS 226.95]PTB51107.1 hypothetical protein M431DRAFT_511231 [Trichoderma harzianum CBS 226.95]